MTRVVTGILSMGSAAKSPRFSRAFMMIGVPAMLGTAMAIRDGTTWLTAAVCVYVCVCV